MRLLHCSVLLSGVARCSSRAAAQAPCMLACERSCTPLLGAHHLVSHALQHALPARPTVRAHDWHPSSTWAAKLARWPTTARPNSNSRRHRRSARRRRGTVCLPTSRAKPTTKRTRRKNAKKRNDSALINSLSRCVMLFVGGHLRVKSVRAGWLVCKHRSGGPQAQTGGAIEIVFCSSKRAWLFFRFVFFCF